MSLNLGNYRRFLSISSTNFAPICVGLFFCISFFHISRLSLLFLILPLLFLEATRIEKFRFYRSVSALFFSLVLFSLAAASWNSSWTEVLPILILTATATLIFFNFYFFNRAATIGVLFILLPFFFISINILLLGIGGNEQPQQIVDLAKSLLLIVPNDYAAFLVVLPLIKHALRVPPSRAGNILLYAMACIAILTAFMLDSLLCILLLAVWLLFESRAIKKLTRKALITGGCILFVLSLFVWQFGVMGSSLELPTSRIPVWDAALRHIASAPFSGSGVDSFRDFYSNHIRTENYAEFILVDSREIPWAHNLFLDLSMAFGIPAAAILLLLYSSILRTTWRSHAACFSSAILFLIASMVEFTHLRLYTVVLIAIHAGYAANVIDKNNKNERGG